MNNLARTLTWLAGVLAGVLAVAGGVRVHGVHEEERLGERAPAGLGQHGYGFTIHSSAEHESDAIKEPVKSVVITKAVPYSLPQPYPVTVEKRVPYAVKVPVHVPVDRPYEVTVLKPYPVAVERPVPYAVEKPVPYAVKVPVKVAVPQPVPYEVRRPYAVPVAVHRPYKVEVPVYVRTKEYSAPIPQQEIKYEVQQEIKYEAAHATHEQEEQPHLASYPSELPAHGSGSYSYVFRH